MNRNRNCVVVQQTYVKKKKTLLKTKQRKHSTKSAMPSVTYSGGLTAQITQDKPPINRVKTVYQSSGGGGGATCPFSL